MLRQFVCTGPVPSEAEIVAQLEAVHDWDLGLPSQGVVLMARRALHPEFPHVVFEGNYLTFLRGKVHQYFEKLYALAMLKTAKQTLSYYRSEGRFWSETDFEIVRYFAQNGVRPSLCALDGVGPVFEAVQPVCRILLDLRDHRIRDQLRTPQLDAKIREAFGRAFGERL